MGGTPEGRSKRVLAGVLANEFPHFPPTVLVTLPSSIESEKSRRDLIKLHRTAKRHNDSDRTGWDPMAPAIWLVTRGTTFLLIINGSWRYARFERGWILKEYDAHDEDHSDDLRNWLAITWPTVSGVTVPCIVEATRSGNPNDSLIERLLAQPMIKDVKGARSWGRWNQARAISIRRGELGI